LRITKDPLKEIENTRKHGLSFELADFLVEDALLAIVYDRFEGDEHRYHAIGVVGGRCLVLVHSYPDPDDESCIRAISLREATRDERRRYQEVGFDGA
jgi:uncharacterized DUF497 family protein